MKWDNDITNILICMGGLNTIKQENLIQLLDALCGVMGAAVIILKEMGGG